MSENHGKSLRSNLGRARGLGSAKEGTHHWWMQRVTSVALIPLSGFFLLNLHKVVDPNLSEAMLFLGKPPVTVALIAFIICAYYHAYLGMQVIIEDYVHGPAKKHGLLLFNQIFFFILGVAAVYAAMTIGFNYADFASQL